MVKSIGLHLLPAVVWLIFYIPLARIATAHGIPTLLIMYMLIAVVLVPVELSILYYSGKRKNGKLSLQGIVLYREKMRLWQYIVYGLLLLAWVFFILSTVGPRLNDFMSSHVFSWIPDWYFLNRGTPEQNRPWMEMSLWILGLIFNGLIGPLTEELYFRGYLLPRLSRLGPWAPLMGVVLFVLYHFWQPQVLATGIVAMLPWIFIVWWKRNIYLSICIHCGLNSLGWVMDLIQRFSST